MISAVKQGELGMKLPKGIETRYCLLYTDRLDLFKDEAESESLNKPRTRIYLDEILSVKFTKACNEHNAGFTIGIRGHDVPFLALRPSTEKIILDEWRVAFASVGFASKMDESRDERASSCVRRHQKKATKDSRTVAVVQEKCAYPDASPQALPILLAQREGPARRFAFDATPQAPTRPHASTFNCTLQDDDYDCVVTKPRDKRRVQTWNIVITNACASE
jgi:hypothetical protein